MLFLNNELHFPCMRANFSLLPQYSKLKFYCNAARYFDINRQNDVDALCSMLCVTFVFRGADEYIPGIDTPEKFREAFTECFRSVTAPVSCYDYLKKLLNEYDIPPSSVVNYCQLCPFSRDYKNELIAEERSVLKYIFSINRPASVGIDMLNTDQETGEWVSKAIKRKIRFSALFDTSSYAYAGKGSIVRLHEILFENSVFWFGCEDFRSYFDSTIKPALLNPQECCYEHLSGEQGGGLTDDELEKCYDYLNREIFTGEISADSPELKNAITKLQTRTEYDPLVSANSVEERIQTRKRSTTAHRPSKKKTDTSPSLLDFLNGYIEPAAADGTVCNLSDLPAMPEHAELQNNDFNPSLDGTEEADMPEENDRTKESPDDCNAPHLPAADNDNDVTALCVSGEIAPEEPVGAATEAAETSGEFLENTAPENFCPDADMDCPFILQEGTEDVPPTGMEEAAWDVSSVSTESEEPAVSDQPDVSSEYIPECAGEYLESYDYEHYIEEIYSASPAADETADTVCSVSSDLPLPCSAPGTEEADLTPMPADNAIVDISPEAGHAQSEMEETVFPCVSNVQPRFTDIIWPDFPLGGYEPSDFIIVTKDNMDIHRAMLRTELDCRTVLVVDAGTLDGKKGFLFYFDEDVTHEFKECFVFIHEDAAGPFIFSSLANTSKLKVCLSPVSLPSLCGDRVVANLRCVSILQKVADEYHSVQNILSFDSCADAYRGLFETGKSLASEIASLGQEERYKLLLNYYSGIAYSINNGYVPNATINLDGFNVTYTYQKDISPNILRPGMILSICNIELPYTCQTEVSEINMAIISKLSSSLALAKYGAKILSENKDGFTLFIPFEKDALTFMDNLNRITDKTIRNLTNAKSVFTCRVDRALN